MNQSINQSKALLTYQSLAIRGEQKPLENSQKKIFVLIGLKLFGY